ncbi:MAG: Thioredoxin reductase [Candidatus Heimdallarchaeota archaeon LC_3]|nr:MAG: Thioredoxin reductase [Candidatus Heimdallarchaeota archaeon LC_3]
MIKQPEITVYGSNWCSDCRRAKKYLGEQRIHYTWRNIEDEDELGQKAYNFVLKANEKVYGKPKRKIPVIEIKEKEKTELMIEPSNIELAKRLGLATKVSKKFYDAVIIGAGPAGLSAAIYLARDGYEVLVIESSTIGGQAYITNRLDNYPGFPDGITGEQFAKNLHKQAKRFGVELLVPQEVKSIGPCHEKGNFDTCTFKEIITNSGESYLGKSILIATGSKYRELVVPGTEALMGTSIHYCATCDGPFYKGKEIFIIGGGNSAFEEALWLKNMAEKVTIIYRRDEPSASPVLQEKIEQTDGIDLWLSTEVIELKGETKLESILLNHKDKNEKKEYTPDGIFVFIGLQPNTKFLQGIINLDKQNFIVTENGSKTSVKGIYAAGDCRKGSSKQAITAAGEGAASALLIREYLKTV